MKLRLLIVLLALLVSGCGDDQDNAAKDPTTTSIATPLEDSPVPPGVLKQAQNRRAQASLRDALTAALSVYTEYQTYYESETLWPLMGVRQSLDFTTGPSTGPDFVSVFVGAEGHTVTFVGKSESGQCFGIVDDRRGGTQYGEITGECVASATPAWKGAPGDKF